MGMRSRALAHLLPAVCAGLVERRGGFGGDGVQVTYAWSVAGLTEGSQGAPGPGNFVASRRIDCAGAQGTGDGGFVSRAWFSRQDPPNAFSFACSISRCAFRFPFPA